MRGATYSLRLVAALGLLVLAGCAALGIGAEAQFLKAYTELGDTFVRTGELYNRLYQEKLVTVDEYRQWARFAQVFKQRYAEINAVYELSADAGVGTEAIIALKRELLIFALKAIQKEAKP